MCLKPVLFDLLECSDPELLNKHFASFIVEVRKTNGENYPPATLHEVYVGSFSLMSKFFG